MTFDELYARVEDAFGAGPEAILRDHGHRIDRSRPVLDIGAGQGRNALYLARAGFVMDAIDPSGLALEAVQTIATREGLSVRTFRCGFDRFEPSVDAYAGVLVFGLIPILTREEIDLLVDRVAAWTRMGDLVFVTAFSAADPAHDRHAREWTRIGRHSFSDGCDGVRTYLEADEILDLFAGWEAIHHREVMGPEHRHGDGPPERHAMVEAVLRRPPSG